MKYLLIFYLSFSTLVFAEDITIFHSWYNKNFNGKMGKDEVNVVLIYNGKGTMYNYSKEKEYNLEWKQERNNIEIKVLEKDKRSEIIKGKFSDGMINGVFINNNTKTSINVIENYDKAIGFDIYAAQGEYNRKNAKNSKKNYHPFYSEHQYLHPVQYRDKRALKKVQEKFYELYFGNNGEDKSPNFDEKSDNYKSSDIIEPEKSFRFVINNIKTFYESVESEYENNFYSKSKKVELIFDDDSMVTILESKGNIEVEMNPQYGEYEENFYSIDITSGEMILYDDIFNKNSEAIFEALRQNKFNDLEKERMREYQSKNIGINRDGFSMGFAQNAEFYVKYPFYLDFKFSEINTSVYKKSSVLYNNREFLKNKSRILKSVNVGMDIMKKYNSADKALDYLENNNYSNEVKEIVLKDSKFIMSNEFKNYIYILSNSYVRYNEAISLISEMKKIGNISPEIRLSEIIAYSKLYLNTSDKKYRDVIVENYREDLIDYINKENNDIIKGIIKGTIKKYKDLPNFPFFCAKKGKKSFFYNKNGKYLFKCDFEEVENFSSFFQIVSLPEKDDYSNEYRFMIIDYKGKVISTDRFYDKNGGIVKIGGKYGVVDRNRIVVEFNREVMTDEEQIIENNEQRLISIANREDKSAIVFTENNKYGLMSDSKEIIVKADYDFIKKIEYSKMFLVELGKKKGVIDDEGHVILELSSELLEIEKYITFENIFFVRFEKKIGVINNNLSGKPKNIIPPIYDVAEVVEIDGEVVIACINNFQRIYVNFNGEKISEVVEIPKIFESRKNKEKFGFINKNGEVILKPRYADVENFFLNFTFIEDGSKRKLINLKGKIIIEDTEKQRPNKIGRNFIVLESNEKKGIIDREGKKIIKQEYDTIVFTD